VNAELDAQLRTEEAASDLFLEQLEQNRTGANVDSLPNHKDVYFSAWSPDRKASMPFDLRKKLGRLRFASRDGDAEKRAANKERAALLLASDSPEVDAAAALVIPRRPTGRPRKLDTSKNNFSEECSEEQEQRATQSESLCSTEHASIGASSASAN